MKKNLLNVLLLPQRELPPLIFGLPESCLNGKILTQRGQNGQKDWQMAEVKIIGKGIMLRYVQFSVNNETVFYSVPMEPVATLHIQVENENFCCYEEESAPKLIPTDHCNFFWQGEKAIETRLLPGSHAFLDVYFRLDFLDNISGGETLEKLKRHMRDTGYTPMDFYSIMADKTIEKLLKEFFDRLMEGEHSLNELNTMVLNLLTRCTGEELSLADAREDQPEEERITMESDQVKQTEKRSKETVHLSLPELRMKVKQMRKKLYSLTKSYHDSKSRVEKLYKRIDDRLKSENDRLADVFMKLARLFADKLKEMHWSVSEESLLKEGIVLFCTRSVELKLADGNDLEFCEEWIVNDSPQRITLGVNEAADLMSKIIFSEFGEKVDFSNLADDEQGKILFTERIRETFGFKPMSHFTGETEKDKPQEIVELYHYLMDIFHDRLSITTDGAFKRDDIIRLLDYAYECNDLEILVYLEIKHLSHEKGYLEKQSREKLILFADTLEKKIAEIRDEKDLFKKQAEYKAVRPLLKIYNDEQMLNGIIDRENELLRAISVNFEGLYSWIKPEKDSSNIISAIKDAIKSL